MRADKDRMSRLRQRIRRLGDEIRQDTMRMLGHRPLLKGSVYLWKHRCGREGCRCNKGRLHENWVFSYRRGGKVRKVYLGAGELDKCRRQVEAHRQLRGKRAALVKRQKELLRLLDELEGLRLTEPPRGRGTRKSK